jgi:hypothetical protein
MAGIHLERDGRYVNMLLEPYLSEAELQQLLADNPGLLSGDLISPSSPLRFVLIRREAGVPDAVAAGNRWSIDHLFIDQYSVPTLVEVKRASDTRIRREVVGQMLDYAANAVVHWPVDRLRSEFEARCEASDLEPSAVLLAALDLDRAECDDDAAIELFWRRAAANLGSGAVRLIFVADEIPAELKRIIEFLNERMNPTEVLGIELRKYEAEGLRALVPTVVGQTAAAVETKRTGSQSAGVLSDAAGVVASRLDELAPLFGLTCEGIGSRRTWRMNKLGVLSLNQDRLEFRLGALDAAGVDTAAWRQALRGLVPDVSKAYPSAKCADLAPRWDEVRERVVRPYLAAWAAVESGSPGA